LILPLRNQTAIGNKADKMPHLAGLYPAAVAAQATPRTCKNNATITPTQKIIEIAPNDGFERAIFSVNRDIAHATKKNQNVRFA
jgi:hypothetical protein